MTIERARSARRKFSLRESQLLHREVLRPIGYVYLFVAIALAVPVLFVPAERSDASGWLAWLLDLAFTMPGARGLATFVDLPAPMALSFACAVITGLVIGATAGVVAALANPDYVFLPESWKSRVFSILIRAAIILFPFVYAPQFGGPTIFFDWPIALANHRAGLLFFVELMFFGYALFGMWTSHQLTRFFWRAR